MTPDDIALMLLLNERPPGIELRVHGPKLTIYLPGGERFTAHVLADTLLQREGPACGAVSPHRGKGVCVRAAGHLGRHRAAGHGESWREPE
jgi:hypothetical protein